MHSVADQELLVWGTGGVGAMTDGGPSPFMLQ